MKKWYEVWFKDVNGWSYFLCADTIHDVQKFSSKKKAREAIKDDEDCYHATEVPTYWLERVEEKRKRVK